MVSMLFRFILLILLLWLLRRIFASLTRAPKQTATKESDAIPANNMVKDPVCGMYMDSRLAVRVENREGTFYFCSDACKSKFMNKSGQTQ
jgi:YHS domain-containing protein